ncbi:transglycosylase SLT domain-containing protein [Priestia megaterium]|uniref:aggregation-promoting factor C-terminal-like domain-containing protein n=1 Tax=Priestia megaterium TaxID=1404 RepID=UPI002E203AAB|nr:transglycosylase SLT domain-containing protein [Priestia megaterium]
MAGTVREMQARFTAITTGMRQGIRQIQRDMQGIGTSTERAVNQSNRSLNQLDATLQRVEQQIEETGNPDAFKELNRALKDSQQEFKSTGRIGERSMNAVQTAIEEARRELTSMTAEGIVEMNALEAAIHDVEQELESLGNHSSLSNVADDARTASGGLDEAGDSVRNLRDDSDDLDVSLRDTNNTLIDLDRNSRNSGDALDRLRDTVMDVTTVGRALKIGLVGLAPAAVPALASVTSGAMGIVSALGAATGGLAGFATVAIPTLTNIFKAQEEINKAQEKVDNATTDKQRIAAMEKLKNLQAALSDEQRKALDALNDFTTYFEQLRKSFEKPVFNIFTQGLQTLQTLLEMFRPVIDASVQSVQNLMNSLDRSLQTKDLEAFFGFLAMRAGPALESVGKSVGYLVRGVLNLMVAFDSQGRTMEQGLLNLTKRFSDWTSALSGTDGFKDFIAYSNANTPTFLNLLNNLWQILKNVTVFLAPIGQEMLVIITYITSFIAKLTEGLAAFSKWEGFVPLLNGLAAAMVAYMIATNAQATALRIAAAAQALWNAVMTANPIGLVIAAVIGLGVALITLYKRNETFRNAVNQAWSSVKNAVVTAVTVIGDVTSRMWDKALEVTQGMRDAISNKVKEWGPAITQGFNAAISSTSSFFVEAGKNIGNLLAQGIGSSGQAIAQGFSEAASSVGSFFSNVGADIANLFGKGFTDQLKFAFTHLSGIISLVAPAFTGLALSMMGVGGPVAFIIGGVVSLIGFLYRLSQTNEDVAQVFSSAWQGIKNIVSSVMTALQPIIQVFQDSFSEMARELGPEFAKTGQVISQSLSQLKPAFGDLGSAFGELGAAFAEIIPQIVQSFSGLLPVILPLIGQLIGAWVEVQTTIAGSVLDIVTSILPLLASVVAQIFPVVIELVKSLVTIWISLFKELVPVILNIVQAVLPDLLSIVQAVFPIILSVIKAVLPVIVSLIGSLIPIVLQIIESVLPVLLSIVQAVFPVILSIIKAVLPVVVTLLQTVIGVVLMLVKTVLPLILSVVQAVFPVVLSIIQGVIPVIVGLLKLVVGVVTDILVPAIKTILEIVQIVFPAIMTVIQNAITIITNIIKLFASVLKGDWSEAWNAVLNILRTVWDTIKTVIQAAVDVVVAVVKGAWTIIKNVTSDVFNAVKSFLSSVWDAIKSAIGSVVNAIVNSIKNSWNDVQTRTTTVFNAVKKFLTDVWNSIKSFIQKAANDVYNRVKTAWNNLKNTTTSVFNSIKKFLSDVWNSIKNTASKLANQAKDGVVNAWNSLKNRTTEMFNNIKKGVTNIFNDIVNAAKKLPGRIGDGIKSMAGGVKKGVTAFANTLVKAMGKGLNGAITGINWVLEKVGADKIKKWEVPEYAKGTKGHKGGLAILGDGGEHELYRTPNGQVGLSPNTDTLMNLPKGTEVLSGKQTKEAMAAIPMYKKGTNKLADGAKAVGGWIKDKAGDAVDKGGELLEHAGEKTKKAASKVKDFALDVWDYASDPVGLMKKVFAQFIPDLPNLKAAASDMLKGGVKKAKDSSIDFIRGKLDEYMSFSGGSDGDPGKVGPGSGFGGMHPYVEKWYNAVKSKFGPTRFMGAYNNRNVRGGSSKSMHAYGRAFDIGGSASTMKKIAEWARTHMNNLQYAIYNRRIAGPGMGKPWRHYSGVNPHVDHVHLDFMNQGGGGGGYSGKVSGKLSNWIDQAMKMRGVSGSEWKNGLGWIINKESTGNPRAVGAMTSDGQAKGLMQLKHFNYKGDPFNPVNNIYWGIKYIKDRYKSIGGALNWWRSHNWYANGTKGHKGGSAVMGDAGKREPFMLPNGLMGLSPAISTLFNNLPKGTVVWKSVQDFMNQMNNGASSILGSNMPSVDLSGISSASSSATTNNSTAYNGPLVQIEYHGTGSKADAKEFIDTVMPVVEKRLIKKIQNDSYKRGMKKN